MGGMVGDQHVNGAITYTRDAGTYIAGVPKWGVDLEIGILRATSFIGQQQVMWAHFSGHENALLLSESDQLHAACGGDVSNMVSSVVSPRQLEIAPFGWLFLHGPIVAFASGQLDPVTGTATHTIAVPPNPALVGLVTWFQALNGFCLSNVLRVEII